MPAGCPRTSSPNPEECEELGKDFVIWATEETDEWRCLPQQWYCLKKGLLKAQWKALKKIPEFRPYYEQAMTVLAKRAVDGTMEKGFGHRYIRIFDPELVEEENEQLKFQSELKKAENTSLGNFIVQTIDYATHKNNPSS